MAPAVATAVVLAAGAGVRFGGRKLLAPLEGRPILQHVLDTLAAAGIDDPIVVLGDDAAELGEAIAWRRAERVANPDPSRGLASSVQLGWEAARSRDPRRPVLIVLGDQPLLRADVVERLVAVPPDPRRPVVVAHHEDGSPNPVRLEPEAADLVAAVSGDRGLGPLINGNPDRVRSVAAEGDNPDVDARADLAALAARRWGEHVRANAAQVDRFREVPDGRDFYGPVSRTFVADPAREGDPVLDALLVLARPEDVWLDVGAGAGRYALPLARRVRSVIAVDPSAAMLDALREGMAGHAIANVRPLEGRWPPDPALRERLGPDPVADVALIAHVGYDVEEIAPFLDAFERAAGRLCVAVLMEGSPASVAAPFWLLVHGEERVPLPALGSLVELLRARGSDPTITLVRGERRRWATRDELLVLLRRQLWTEPGSAADDRLVAAIDGLAEADGDGSLSIPGAGPLDVGIVSWAPGGAAGRI